MFVKYCSNCFFIEFLRSYWRDEVGIMFFYFFDEDLRLREFEWYV